MHLIRESDTGNRPGWRTRLRSYFDNPSTPAGQVVNWGIALLILLSAAIFVIETYPISAPLRQGLTLLDWGIVLAFSLEYALRLASSEQPWRYVFSLYGLLDLMAIVPYLLGFLDVRFIRLLRWLRLLQLIRFFEQGQLFGRLTGADGLVFTRIFVGLGATIFIYSGLIFQVEHIHNPENFRTFFDALYFAVVTMTTVGYGDVTPVSDAGRGLTVMMILTGIALIPTLVGNLIRQVAKVANARQQPCSNCGLGIHDADAQFCKQCGTSLSSSPQPDPETDPA